MAASVVTGKAVRLSSDGPPMGNSDGGEFVPGEGMCMRLVENAVGVSLTISTAYSAASEGPAVTITNPDPDKKYRAEGFLALIAGATAAGDSDCKLEVSYDGGTAWTTVATDIRDIDAETGVVMHPVLPLTKASDLPGWPATTPASLMFRMQAKVTTATTIGVDQNGGSGFAAGQAQPYKLQVSEHL